MGKLTVRRRRLVFPHVRLIMIDSMNLKNTLVFFFIIYQGIQRCVCVCVLLSRILKQWATIYKALTVQSKKMFVKTQKHTNTALCEDNKHEEIAVQIHLIIITKGQSKLSKDTAHTHI